MRSRRPALLLGEYVRRRGRLREGRVRLNQEDVSASPRSPILSVCVFAVERDEIEAPPKSKIVSTFRDRNTCPHY